MAQQFRSDIEELFLQLSSESGVVGVMIVTRNAVPVKSTIEDTFQQSQYAHVISTLVNKARFLVQDLADLEEEGGSPRKPAPRTGRNWTSALTFLRLRTREHEIFVSPDDEHILIVIQKVYDPDVEGHAPKQLSNKFMA